MRQLRAAADRDLGAVKAEREGMRRRVTEATAFSEARKSEVRTWMRGLTDKERIGLAHTTKDPLIVESITTAPHFLSGLKEDHWNGLTERIVEHQNYARLAVLAAEETAFLEADAALKVAAADLRREAGLGEHEFAELAA